MFLISLRTSVTGIATINLCLHFRTVSSWTHVNWCILVVDVQILILSAIHLSGTELVIRGNPIHLVCNVSGGQSYPPRDVFWYKDGQLLEPDPSAGRVITSKLEMSTLVSVLVSVLVIRRSTVSHAGQYYCRSTSNQLDHITVRVLTGKNFVKSSKWDVNNGSGGYVIFVQLDRPTLVGKD